MTDFIQLERIYRYRDHNASKDTLLFFPVSEIKPRWTVEKVRPPSHGQNDNIDLAGLAMLLLRPTPLDDPNFALYYTEYDPTEEEVEVGTRLKILHQVLLRYGSDEYPLVWTIGKDEIKRLNLNTLPAGWQKKAVLAVFDIGNEKCEIRTLASDPTVTPAPDPCELYCKPPPEGMDQICRAWRC